MTCFSSYRHLTKSLTLLLSALMILSLAIPRDSLAATSTGSASDLNFEALVEAGLQQPARTPTPDQVKASAKARKPGKKGSRLPASVIESATHITGGPVNQSVAAVKIPDFSSFPPKTAQKLIDLTKAIDAKMKAISDKYSLPQAPSQPALDLDAKLGDKGHENFIALDGKITAASSMSRRKSSAGSMVKAASQEVPWTEVIESIKALPQAKVDDPIVKSAVSSTIKMLSTPDFQAGFVKVVRKHHRPANGKRGLIMAIGAAVLVGQYLMPAINGAVAGAATAAGNSYGQGAGSYVMNTLGGAFHGAAQAVQDTMTVHGYSDRDDRPGNRIPKEDR